LDSRRAQADLVSLIAGELDTATLAARHDVTEAEAERWRSVFLAGMKASVGGQSLARPRLHRMVVLAGVVLATAAFAQLAVFNADQPAQASQVNGNFNQLKTWLEAKVGAVPGNSITTTSVTATGAVTTSGAVTGGTVTGGAVSSTGTITASGRVTGSSLSGSLVNWNDVSPTFPGGAGIVNDNVFYNALMVAGNTTGGGVRKVNLYDDVTVANDLVVSANTWAGTPTDLAVATFASSNAYTYTQCANGQYVCGLGLGHEGGNSAYYAGARLILRCCRL
jgi:hypothetical protein